MNTDAQSEESAGGEDDARGEQYPGPASEGLAATEKASPTPTIGRIVHYVLSEDDAVQINRRYDDYSKAPFTDEEKWPRGSQAHVGNRVDTGEIVALIVARIVDNNVINGQAILDGNDSLWVASVQYGTEQGNWFWPPKV